MHSSTVAITGAAGFLGWHLRTRLYALRPDITVRAIDREGYADDSTLLESLSLADVVVHLAGANRGTQDDVYAANIALARRLTATLDEAGAKPHVVYASSVQADTDSIYGQSKREAGEILAAWGKSAAAPVAQLLLPNLFGECGKPYYNSAVATFCHELALGGRSEINAYGRTELLHVQDACAALLSLVDGRAAGTRRIQGVMLGIPDVYERLRRMRETYGAAILPELPSRLDVHLFNALRTAMFPRHYPLELPQHLDHRGAFFELARGHGQTQASFSSTVPGVTRGDHFHLTKFERFVVVRGEGLMRIRRLFSDDVTQFLVSGDHPVAVDMPPLHAHNITNVGNDDLLTCFWANDHFDPDLPDTFPEVVTNSPQGAA